MYVLFADKVACPMTQHYVSGDSQISNSWIPCLTLYKLSHCASQVQYLCKYDVVGGRAPFFSLDETQEQHIGHCESARQMLGRAFVLFLASQWPRLILYIYMRAVNNLIWPFTYACLS